ncbi:MAG: glycine C-acetyltransferase [Phycicoccus sp.]|nr:glycine C-acetyltransferase [Phycicoccus sp.]
MYTIKDELAATLHEIDEAGLTKREREITTPQAAHIATESGPSLNFCANNYLGFADHPEIVQASQNALAQWGFGMASVRFICGTQSQHTALEAALSTFLRTEATILYSSCFDANGGVFEVLFGEGDAIISDELNHASLIDGIRLSKAARYRYRNADMTDLRTQLESARAAGANRVVVVTDGVFSMDGSFAPLDQICDLADEFTALVLVDDSHAVGFVGAGGRGTPELFGVQDRVDIITGTLGKALGGASGGYVSSHAEVVELLRQRSRPYLFSNSVAPAVVAGSLKALELVSTSSEARETLQRNASVFRELMEQAGFDLLPGAHPIVPVMFPGEDGARQAAQIADRMLANGVYVIAFSFPVVPRGKARIRVQLSAAHSEDDVRRCVAAFVDARDAVG